MATATSRAVQHREFLESEAAGVSPSTSSLLVGVSALWSGEHFIRARRLPNKGILIKDETQGSTRRKEKSPEDAVQPAAPMRFHPHQSLAPSWLCIRWCRKGGPDQLARATAPAQGHFFLPPEPPTLLLKTECPGCPSRLLAPPRLHVSVIHA